MIELFTMGAPSPGKVSIMLEEVGLPYEWHWVNAYAGEHKQPAFLAKSPNGLLPAMIDHDAPDGPLLL
ncbi:glutathione S-transferase [Novosphingobium hassiacum]|uniref:Glutathione S-transferase n=1 Tax=Novosphingobium hassiacum TaxID=173676 RepID=A0A7W5ZRS9_9SPHN|nr:glutathione S-transferase N-terminal domain-containing protein [Novosphingobium hassiacum]MBB3858820.1 glutathione S-transferase [Novosphingobium hassiacum]